MSHPHFTDKAREVSSRALGLVALAIGGAHLSLSGLTVLHRSLLSAHLARARGLAVPHG